MGSFGILDAVENAHASFDEAPRTDFGKELDEASHTEVGRVLGKEVGPGLDNRNRLG